MSEWPLLFLVPVIFSLGFAAGVWWTGRRHPPADWIQLRPGSWL